MLDWTSILGPPLGKTHASQPRRSRLRRCPHINVACPYQLLAACPAARTAAYRKVTIKGVTSVALCPATEGPAVSRLAAFIPEAKGSPASAGIYSWAGEGPVEPQPIVKKSFFRTQGEWEAGGGVG